LGLRSIGCRRVQATGSLAAVYIPAILVDLCSSRDASR
jgi:hypothetical protein